MLYEDYKVMKDKETLDFHAFSKWHALGFKGDGVKILNLEGLNVEHGKITYGMIKTVAPNADIHWCDMSFRVQNDVLTSFKAVTKDGEITDLDKFALYVKQFDVITVSMVGTFGNQLNKAFVDSGAILMSAAGNEAMKGVFGRFREVGGFQVGAIRLSNGQIVRQEYSSIGEELDFATLHGSFDGTSLASPVLAGLVALIIQRYGKMAQDTMREVLKSISVDAGDIGFDTSFGWGVPVLPDNIKMLQTGIGGFLPVNNIHHTPLIQDNILNFKGRESYPMIPDYITIHNFGSSASARDVTKYVDNTDEVKSWHFTVGKDAIYQEMSIFQNGWHAGDGLNGTGNRKSAGIEVEENLDAMMNTVRLVVFLRKYLGRKLEIKFHGDWSNKDCPRWILKNYSKDIFVRLVEEMEMRFKDVEQTRWSFKAIDKLSELGILSGFPDGTFKPSDMLTREQYAQGLYNTLVALGFIK